MREQREIVKILACSDRSITQAKSLGVVYSKLKSHYLAGLLSKKASNAVTIEGLVEKIEGGGTPSKSVPEYWGGSIPWASVKDLKGDELSTTQDYITEAGLQNSSAKLIPARTPIMATRMNVGKVVKFTRDVAINQDLKALFPKVEVVIQM